MPAEAKATLDGVVGRINEITFGCDLASEGEAAGKNKRAAYQDVSIGMFHHVFPESDNSARAIGSETGATFLAKKQAANPEF